jgi:hypothetical protein
MRRNILYEINIEGGECVRRNRNERYDDRRGIERIRIK